MHSAYDQVEHRLEEVEIYINKTLDLNSCELIHLNWKQSLNGFDEGEQQQQQPRCHWAHNYWMHSKTKTKYLLEIKNV